MISYFIKRLIQTLPVIWGVCTLAFLLIHFVPGDPIEIMLGEQASSVDREVLRADLGLDRPLLEQYGSFITGVLRFDLGKSLRSRQSVMSEIKIYWFATFELAFTSMILALLMGIPLGVWAAVKQYKWPDWSIFSLSLFGMSLPGIFLGPLLIWIFAIQLNWFPVSEREAWYSLVLPAVSLALPLSAVLIRLTRASMLEVIHEDYIRTARSKGLGFKKIYFKHALKNALIPIITIVGLQSGALLTGTVITESIFDWPGLGTLLLRAIQGRDYPVVQACILLISLIYVSVNFITDIAYAAANPKVRLDT